jgi:hypothetical protein
MWNVLKATALVLVVLIVPIALLSAWINSPKPAPTMDVALARTLVLWEPSQGLFDLSPGSASPIPATDPPFDARLVTGRISGHTPDWHYLVFQPHYLLDTRTSRVTALEHSGDTLYRGVFSADEAFLAYSDGMDVWLRDLSTDQTTELIGPYCQEYYNAPTACADIGEVGWLPGDVLMISHHEDEGTAGPVGPVNHVEVVRSDGSLIGDWPSPWDANYRILPNVVLREAYYDRDTGEYKPAASLVPADLARGVYEPRDISPTSASGEWRKASLQIGDMPISPSGHLMIWIGYQASTAQIFDPTTGKLVASIGGSVPHAADCLWSVDESQVACQTAGAGASGSVWLLPISGGHTAGRLISNPPTESSEWGWELVAWH